MRLKDFPEDIRPYILPEQGGDLVYRCLGCGAEYGIKELLYTCPDCGDVFLIFDKDIDRLKKIPGELWHRIFDYRKMLKMPSFKGIYRIDH